jgi:hypothetical protein
MPKKPKPADATASSSLPTSVDELRAAEERVRADRRHANELVGLVGLCDECDDGRLRLAALQACRSLFEGWAAAGELSLRRLGAVDAAQSEEEPLAAYQAWLLRQYLAFVGALRKLLQGGSQPLALRLPALDTLLVLAAAEARRGSSGAVDPEALDAPNSAFRQALSALVQSKGAAPPELLGRLAETHLVHLDASFYLLRHVHRLARLKPPHTPPKPERLLDLLLLVVPPPRDVEPRQASFLAPPPKPPRRKGGAAEGGGRAELAGWAAASRQLLLRRKHASAFCKAWRALLEMELPPAAFRTEGRHSDESPRSPEEQE